MRFSKYKRTADGKIFIFSSYTKNIHIPTYYTYLLLPREEGCFFILQILYNILQNFILFVLYVYYTQR